MFIFPLRRFPRFDSEFHPLVRLQYLSRARSGLFVVLSQGPRPGDPLGSGLLSCHNWTLLPLRRLPRHDLVIKPQGDQHVEEHIECDLRRADA